jgi:poly-gamma-glutamate synthesis protein (capsule biosynthesis protein)
MSKPLRRIDLHGESADSVRLLFVGDFCLRSFEDDLKGKFASKLTFSDELLVVLGAKDFSVVNQECPFIQDQRRRLHVGRSLFAAQSETIEAFRKAEFDAVVLANNHMLDYGQKALLNTMEVFDGAGIRYVGVGKDIDDAIKPMIVEANGVKIGICAFVEQEFSCATEHSFGTAPLDPITVAGLVKNLKSVVDFVVVYAHGGNEYYPVPSPRIKKWYRFFIDSGANVVVGTHPHTIQGIEIYKGSPIIYSLGNFMFHSPDVRKPKCWDYGLIACLTVSDKKVSMLETWISKVVTSDKGAELGLVNGSEGEQIGRWFDRLNTVARDSELVQEYWKWFCRDKSSSYLNTLKFCVSKLPINIKSLLGRSVYSRRFDYIIFNMWTEIINTLRKKESIVSSFEILKSQDALATIFDMERLSIVPKPEFEMGYRDIMKFC